jgi:hypothetical protein
VPDALATQQDSGIPGNGFMALAREGTAFDNPEPAAPVPRRSEQ